MPERKLRIGLILNPVAGLGGPTGLKGTDGMVDEAIRRGGVSQVSKRVKEVLADLPHERIDWYSAPGSMGSDLLAEINVRCTIAGAITEPTSAQDTQLSVVALEENDIDLLLFAGGDGTARDVFDSAKHCPAFLGIPCGVKMHSGVFATSPGAAADLIGKLLDGEMLSVFDAEVRDIDEASFRDGIVKTRYYGELPVPDDLRYMQQTKVGGREVEELVVQEIAADFIENLDSETLYVMGSGSTVAGILEAMHLDSTLLGVDLMADGKIIASDLSEAEILANLDNNQPAKIVITAISGQGHILGRGNQQISPAVVHRVGIENIVIVASKSKLAGLENRPLLVDTGDSELDETLKGLRPVITGYEDRVLYRVA